MVKKRYFVCQLKLFCHFSLCVIVNIKTYTSRLSITFGRSTKTLRVCRSFFLYSSTLFARNSGLACFSYILDFISKINNFYLPTVVFGLYELSESAISFMNEMHDFPRHLGVGTLLTRMHPRGAMSSIAVKKLHLELYMYQAS